MDVMPSARAQILARIDAAFAAVVAAGADPDEARLDALRAVAKYAPRSFEPGGRYRWRIAPEEGLARLEELRAYCGGDRKLAAALGAEHGQVTRWRRGEQVPSPAMQQRINARFNRFKAQRQQRRAAAYAWDAPSACVPSAPQAL